MSGWLTDWAMASSCRASPTQPGLREATEAEQTDLRLEPGFVNTPGRERVDALNLPLRLPEYPYSCRATTRLHVLGVPSRRACRRGLRPRADRRYASMSFPLRNLPVMQNWDCHSCGDCCRVRGGDHRRREATHRSAGLANDPEVAPKPWFAPAGRGSKKWRLTHRPDGGCVFLTTGNHCRLQERFGSRGQTVRMPFVSLYPHTGGQSLARRHAFLLPVGRGKFGPPGGRR